MTLHVAVVAAHSPAASADALTAFARRLADDVAPVLEEASGTRWAFHPEERVGLPGDEPRRPSDFLGPGSLRMVEGPYDAVVVVTDVGVISRQQHLVPGLASPVARLLVLSTRELRRSPRGEPTLSLDHEGIRWNAATLLLHLLGHTLGLEHERRGSGTIMAPFEVDTARRELPAFSGQSCRRMTRLAHDFPEREDVDEGTFSEILFHLSSAARHPWQILRTLIRSRAPLLPLHLPRLSTAAVAPAFILVFTAEIWDAGFHMTDQEVWLFAALSILASAAYLPVALSLLLPRKERRFHTEHLAVVNVAILLNVALAIIGLFVMLVLIMLLVQIFIFPPDLVREWPSLELGSATITLVDQLRIAALISSIGVLTGALAGWAREPGRPPPPGAVPAQPVALRRGPALATLRGRDHHRDGAAGPLAQRWQYPVSSWKNAARASGSTSSMKAERCDSENTPSARSPADSASSTCRQTPSGSASNREMWKSIGSYWSQMPPSLRKSGIPEGVDTPAPVIATTESASRIAPAAKRSSVSSM